MSDTRRWMLMLDGRAHRRIRSLVNPMLSAGSIQKTRPLVARITTTDVTVSQKTIPSGSKLTILLDAANRHPRRYDNPDSLDVSRTDIKPLAFGDGPHHCIGALLGKRSPDLAGPPATDTAPHVSPGSEERITAAELAEASLHCALVTSLSRACG
ncbi:cytochrome P450 [Streptomyces sp. NPDC050619]|uniref:cytochrome P450 n=1 Tax=Streptomyces sp. NPDC050619 TaxID=3157214 RepID=UPI00341FAAB8